MRFLRVVFFACAALLATRLPAELPIADWRTVATTQITTGSLAGPNADLRVLVSLVEPVQPIGSFAFELRAQRQDLNYFGTVSMQEGIILSAVQVSHETDLIVRIAGIGSTDPTLPALFQVNFRVRPQSSPSIAIRLGDSPIVENGTLLVNDEAGSRVPHMFDTRQTSAIPFSLSPEPYPGPPPLEAPRPIVSAEGIVAVILATEDASFDANRNLEALIDGADIVTYLAREPAAVPSTPASRPMRSVRPSDICIRSDFLRAW